MPSRAASTLWHGLTIVPSPRPKVSLNDRETFFCDKLQATHPGLKTLPPTGIVS